MSSQDSSEKQLAIKKAIIAKYLFLHASSLAERDDPLGAAMSVNSLHDAVEIILLAIEDVLGIDQKIAQFKTHLKKIQEASDDRPIGIF